MASSKKAIYAALIGNSLIAFTKFVAAALTGSSAILAEGFHSAVDTGNQLLLLHGLKKSHQQANAQFPFGYGKEVYFWSFVVAILIFALGSGISIYEGIIHLVHPEPMTNAAINYVILVLAMLFEGFSWFVAFREFRHVIGRRGILGAVRRGKDPSMFLVLFEDSAAMLGLIVALAGIFLAQITGNPFFDGAASIVIGLILGLTAIWLAYETKGLLIGESANREVVRGIRRIACSFPGVENVNEVLTLHMGPEYILVNLSLDFRDSITAGRMETIVAELDKTIKRIYPLVQRVFVEAEKRADPAASCEDDEER